MTEHVKPSQMKSAAQTLRRWPVTGAGGGKGGKFVEDPNSLRSTATGYVLDAISEGEIRGLVNGDKSIYLDNTPIRSADGTANFNGVQWVFTPGLADQDYIAGFPSAMQPVADFSQLELKAGISNTRRISDLDADAVIVTLNVPALNEAQDNGQHIAGSTVVHNIYVKSRADAGTDPQVLAAVSTISGKCVSPYEEDYRIDLPGQGPWDVTIVRQTADSNTVKLTNATNWSRMQLVYDHKFTYPFTALIGVGVDAQYFGTTIPARAYEVYGLIIRVPSNYDPIARSYTGLWDGTFKWAWTNNPAWVMYDIATNTRYGAGIDPVYVDKWSLYQIARYCDAINETTGTFVGVPDGYGGVEPRFAFNGVINKAETVYNVLTGLASAFRGMTYWSAGLFSLAQDRPQGTVKIFAPANVINGDFEYAGTSKKARHTVAIVSWNNPQLGYTIDYEVIPDKEGIKRYGMLPTEVAAIGCTSRGQARRFGRWLLATEILETETVKFTSGYEAADLVPGEVIEIVDPAYAGPRMGGRILDVATSSVRMDTPFPFAAGEEYELSVMTKTGQLFSAAVTNAPGSTDIVTLATPLPSGDMPIVGAIFALSEIGSVEPRPFRVLSIADATKGQFEVLALEYRAEKYDIADNSANFIEDPAGTYQKLPNPSYCAPPTDMQFRVETRTSGASVANSLIVTWTKSDTTILSGYMFSYRVDSGNWASLPQTGSTEAIIDSPINGAYECRVFAVNTMGVPSAVLSGLYNVQDATNVNARAMVTNPTTPEGMVTFSGPDLAVRWDARAIGAPDGQVGQAFKDQFFAGFKVTVYAANGVSVRRTAIVTDASYVYTYDMQNADGGPIRGPRIGVQMLDVNGNLSAMAATTFTNPAPTWAVQPAATGTLDGIMVTVADPADPDYAGYRVYADTTSPVALTNANLRYTGTGSRVTIPKLAQATHYLKLVPFDVFGDGTPSAEISAGPTDVTGQISQAQSDIASLIATYGSTQSAAQQAAAAASSAAAAASSASVANTYASAASTAKDQAQAASSAASTAQTAAETAKTNAQSAQTAAQSARDAALGYQTGAQTARDAAQSAQGAAQSARDAAQASQSAAAQSVTDAYNQAFNALSFRNDAATYASNAHTSETNAAGSASSASTSAGAAATSATNSGNSASAAAGSASSASTSATNAGNSATAAAGSATNAASSAGAASVSAGQAATSATNAAGSASSASSFSSTTAGYLNSARDTAAALFPPNLDPYGRDAYRIDRSTEVIGPAQVNDGWPAPYLAHGDPAVSDMYVFPRLGIPAVQGRRHRATGWAYAWNSACAAGMWVGGTSTSNWDDGTSQNVNATVSSPPAAIVSGGLTANTWTKVGIDFTVPAGWPAYVRPMFHIYNAANYTGPVGNHVYLTGIKFEDITSEYAAGLSATAAATSASNAAISATNAGNSASSALTQATNAATSAGQAGTSASNANTSASQASSSASNAAGSASSASNSATLAAQAQSSAASRNIVRKGTFSDGSVGQWYNPTGGPCSVINPAYYGQPLAPVSGGKALFIANTRDAFEGDWIYGNWGGRKLHVYGHVSVQFGAFPGGLGYSMLMADGTQSFWWQNAAGGGGTYGYQLIDAVTTIPAGVQAIIPFVIIDGDWGQPSMEIRISDFRLEDVTESQAASGYASAAATSASNAGASQTAAGNSATSASNSATSASTSANDAATQASNAYMQASNALTFAGQAQTYANNASTSATGAAGSASTASTQAGAAATSATNAANSASAASGSASSASTSATNAGNSASAAAASATSANTSAGNASTSASQAATSASNASGSANSAASSATTAASAKDGATSVLQAMLPGGLSPDQRAAWIVENNVSIDGPAHADWGWKSPYLARTDTSHNVLSIYPAKGIVTQPGRRYRYTAWAIGDATNAYVNIWLGGTNTGVWSDGTSVGVSGDNVAVAPGCNGGSFHIPANTWVPIGLDVTIPASGWPPYWFPIVQVLGLSGWGGAAQNFNAGNMYLSAPVVTDITSEYAAGLSATAAATSASSASASQTAAGQSASTATTQANNASTSAGQAASSASSAATSASNASGSANTASTYAGNAASSAGNAFTYAGNAYTYAGNAASSASSAATSATNAAGSANSAATSSSVSATAAAQLLPSGFTPNEHQFWISDEGNYTPGNIWGDDWFGSASYPVFASRANQYALVASRGTFVPTPGRRYRVSIDIARVVEATNGRPSFAHFGLYRQDGSGAWQGVTSAVNLLTAMPFATWTTFDLDWVADGNLFWARPRAHINWDNAGSSYSDAVYHVRRLQLTDITESYNAAGSATAAASSASSAAASATTAGQQASSATTSANNAATSAGQASSSAGSAATSASNASGSANSAATYASNAAGSASTASTQASNASTSATNAATYAGNASTSAGQAATYASNAAGSASSASTSATNAANSATSAGNSASAASSSASSASTSASSAGTSATAASNSANSASGSASAASTSASNAAGSASSASGSASTASTYASNAATYAGNANTSATNAASSASAASASESSAATSATLSAAFTGGGNLLNNTDFPNGLTAGWAFGKSNGSMVFDNVTVNGAGSDWHPVAENVLSMRQDGRLGTGTDIGEWGSAAVSATAGEYYQAYAYCAAHRAPIAVVLVFLDDAGNWTGYGYAGDAVSTGGKNPANWTQVGVKAIQAPAGTTRMFLALRKIDTNSGQSDSWAWFWRPYIGKARSGQTLFNNYSPGGSRYQMENVQAAISYEADVRTNAIASVATSVSTINASIAVKPNILKNPSATNGTTGWNQDNPSYPVYVSLGTYGEGNIFVSASGNNTTGSGLWQDVDYQSTAAISLQAEIYAGGVTGSAQVRAYVQWLDSGHNHLGYSGQAVVNAGNSGWNLVKIENQTPPSGVRYARVHLDIWGGSTWSNTSAAWKRVKLEQGASCTLYSDDLTASQFSASITMQSSSIATLQSQASTFTQRLSAGSPNLLPNGGFESGLAKWTNVTNWNVQVAGSGAWTNYWGAYVSTWIDGTQVLVSDRITATAGQVHTLSYDSAIWGSGTHGYCDVIYYDASNNVLLDGGQVDSSGHDFSNTFEARQSYAHTETAPTGTAYLVVRCVAFNANGGSCNFRQIKLEAGSVATDYTAEASAAYQAGVIADHTGKLQSYVTLSTSAGAATASVKLMAVDGSGNPTSSIGFEAQEVVVTNAAGTNKKVAMKIANGNATFDGDIIIGGRILFTNGLALRMAVAPYIMQVGDGDSISYPNAGYLPIPTFQSGGLAPIGTTENYNLYLDNQTASGATVRLKVNVPGAPTNYNLTTDAAGGTGQPNRVVSKGSNPDAVGNQYRVQGTWSTTSTAYYDSYGLYYADWSVAIYIYAKVSGSWVLAGSSYLSGTNSYFTPGTKTITGAFDEVVTAPSGVTDIGATDAGGGSVTSITSVSWTAPGTASSSRSATPGGEKCQLTLTY